LRRTECPFAGEPRHLGKPPDVLLGHHASSSSTALQNTLPAQPRSAIYSLTLVKIDIVSRTLLRCCRRRSGWTRGNTRLRLFNGKSPRSRRTQTKHHEIRNLAEAHPSHQPSPDIFLFHKEALQHDEYSRYYPEHLPVSRLFCHSGQVSKSALNVIVPAKPFGPSSMQAYQNACQSRSVFVMIPLGSDSEYGLP
jgi:hypothetical protein